MKPIINSVKHIVQRSLTTITAQDKLNVLIARSVTSEPSANNDVVVGAVVKAIFLEYWLLGSSAQPVTTTWTVEKLPNDSAVMTFVQGQDLHSYANKKNIIRTGQGLVGDSNTNPIPVIREWIKIPKGMQRMAQGDKWYLNVNSVGEQNNDLEICGIAIYKEYQ